MATGGSVLTDTKCGLPSLPFSEDYVSSTVDLEETATELGIDYFLVSYAPLNTDSRTALVPRSAISNVQRRGCGVPGAMFFDCHGADPEMQVVPDPSSLVQLPWKPEIGWLSSTLYMEGEPFAQCPRYALLRQCARARNMGYLMKAGIEPEFTLLDKDGKDFGDFRDARQAMSLQEPLATYRQLPLLTKIHEVMDSLGWGPYELDHEASCCQYEVNYGYTDCLRTADRQGFLKFMIKQLAENEGYTATFMPCPKQLICANGLHINVSLWDVNKDENMFPDDGDPELGISTLCRNFVGGLLKHAQPMCAMMCPTVNSYKRLNAGSWCPNTVTWGGNNRTVLLRVSANNRVEHRLADGATNPYLAVASILAAGLDGIENNIDPGPGYKDQVNLLADANPKDFQHMPDNLYEALHILDSSDYMKSALSEELVSAFIKLKKNEWKEYCKHLTSWETKWYLNC